MLRQVVNQELSENPQNYCQIRILLTNNSGIIFGSKLKPYTVFQNYVDILACRFNENPNEFDEMFT